MHLHAGLERGPSLLGSLCVRGDARLHEQIAGSAFMHHRPRLGHCEHRPAAAGLPRRESLDFEPMRGGRRKRTGDHGAVTRPRHHEPGFHQQPAAGAGLEVAPQSVGPLQERHVVGVLEVREPDEPRLAVRAALVVGDGKAVEAEHTLAARCEVTGGSTADAAEANDDNVECAHGVGDDT